MFRSEYHIPQMDCPSEENMVRLKLKDLSMIQHLQFDLDSRNLTVYHREKSREISARLEELNLGSKLIGTVVAEDPPPRPDDEIQSRLLRTVLAINFGFFIIEIAAGLISRSMGLLADSLDMLADASVYGLSLWAVGSTAGRKKTVARYSGIVQFVLAGLGMAEVIRRFLYSTAVPDFRVMVVVSLLALVANSVCLYLLQRSGSEEAHMKASMIFTSNDVIINSGVILAGVLVLLTHTIYPDLIVGSIVFLIVVRGAVRMVRL